MAYYMYTHMKAKTAERSFFLDNAFPLGRGLQILKRQDNVHLQIASLVATVTSKCHFCGEQNTCIFSNTGLEKAVKQGIVQSGGSSMTIAANCCCQ